MSGRPDVVPHLPLPSAKASGRGASVRSGDTVTTNYDRKTLALPKAAGPRRLPRGCGQPQGDLPGPQENPTGTSGGGVASKEGFPKEAPWS